jgi:DnaJ-class molecular chaperone
METAKFAEIKEKLKTNNPFIILDLDLKSENLNTKNIRKKCNQLSLKYHPDKNGNTAESHEIQTAINTHCTKLKDILNIENDKEKRMKLFQEYYRNSVKFDAAKKIGISAALLGASYIGYKWLTKRSRQKTQRSSTEKSVSKSNRRSRRSQSSFTPSKR